MSSVVQVVFLPLQADTFAAAIAVTPPTEQAAGALPKLGDVNVASANDAQALIQSLKDARLAA